MKKTAFIVVSHLLFGCSLIAQQSPDINITGRVIGATTRFKYFAILMQDTSLSGNRFNNWFNIPKSNNYTTNPPKTILYPAFIIDSSLFSVIEARLLNNDSNIVYYNYPSGLRLNQITKYIRLYIGYLDEQGNINVVIQFLTHKEYKNKSHIYSKELFLIVNQRRLRFAIVKF